MKTKRALILATSRKTRGGVTAVLKAYEQFPFWEMYKVRWIETHIDKHKIVKYLFAIKALVQYIMCVWFYDIVHIHTSELPSVRRKYLFFKIAKLLRKKIIIHLHIGNQLAEQKGNFYYKELFEGADKIIVLSQSIRQTLIRLFGVEKKIYVINNPCPIVPSVQYSDTHKEILFAGTLNQNKGYSVLIRAFAQIASSFPEWKLVIAGNGELAKAKQIASECGILDQVLFPGWVKGKLKDLLFRKASVFCLASYAEGFPMAVLDAWSYGIPVISTPVGGLPDVLLEGENVLFFQPGDIDGLSDKLKYLLTDASLRLRLSEASLCLANSKFSVSYINEQLMDLYENL
ncbi:MAG: glycosyltransferase family 4 protein [Parabacteroides distasonis]|nr:glycosyltransferase family 4 protein [Parabacteroides distasonis]